MLKIANHFFTITSVLIMRLNSNDLPLSLPSLPRASLPLHIYPHFSFQSYLIPCFPPLRPFAISSFYHPFTVLNTFLTSLPSPFSSFTPSATGPKCRLVLDLWSISCLFVIRYLSKFLPRKLMFAVRVHLLNGNLTVYTSRSSYFYTFGICTCIPNRNLQGQGFQMWSYGKQTDIHINQPTPANNIITPLSGWQNEMYWIYTVFQFFKNIHVFYISLSFIQTLADFYTVSQKTGPLRFFDIQN